MPRNPWNYHTDDFLRELRGWKEVPGQKVSDDARRMMWLMQRAADEIERLGGGKQMTDGKIVSISGSSDFEFTKSGQPVLALTMEEAKRVLEWRALIHPKEEEKHWGDDDSALAGKLLDFVDD